MKWGPAFGLLLFTLPSIASAQVVINEVMYDPSGSNSGRQWIELFNAGASDVQMVAGTVKGSWRVSDGSNHTLIDPSTGVGQGSLTIPAGGYLIITSDPPSFLAEYPGSYSVVKSSIALKATGGSVSIIDGNGSVVDSMNYSPSVGAAGDGASLQKQSDGSWIEALPTPGSANSSVVYVPPPQIQTQSSSTSPSNPQPLTVEPSYVPPPTPDLYADAGSDHTVIVGADVEFDASAYDKNQTLIDPTSVRFSWNFGDGATAEGAAVLHHFSYPGKYAVTLNIAQKKDAASDDIVVTAEPAALSFSLLPDGGVDIENLAGHDLDLSDWILRQDGGPFSAQFMLPDNSKILAGSSMKISSQTLTFRASSSTTLEYPNGALALGIGEAAASTSSPLTVEVQKAPLARAASSVAPQTSTQDSIEIPTPDMPQDSALPDSNASASSTASPPAQTAAAAASRPNYLWWFGVAALALSAGAGTIAAKQFKKREWDIVEDTDN